MTCIKDGARYDRSKMGVPSNSLSWIEAQGSVAQKGGSHENSYSCDRGVGTDRLGTRAGSERALRHGKGGGFRHPHAGKGSGDGRSVRTSRLHENAADPGHRSTPPGGNRLPSGGFVVGSRGGEAAGGVVPEYGRPVPCAGSRTAARLRGILPKLDRGPWPDDASGVHNVPRPW